MKVSYSCTDNICSVISSHKKKLIKNNAPNTKPCNSRTKSKCPLNGQCQSQDIIYKCTVSRSVYPDKVYSGTAEGDFKKRYDSITKSFRNERYTKKQQKYLRVYMGNKGKTPRKSVFEMVDS